MSDAGKNRASRIPFLRWFTPWGFVTIAAVLAIGYLVVHLLGWREYAGFLSGTLPSGGSEFRVVLGLLYVVAYFGFVLAMPILLIAAGVFALLLRPARIAKVPVWIWALPWTLPGLAVGLVAMASGGRGRSVAGVIEFYGGAIPWLFARLPARPSAMTLGHVLLGRTAAALDTARDHELVHVRQYERWGPIFVPAYLLCSLVLWIKRKDAYRDNPFEREAFDAQNRATIFTTPRIE